MLVVAAKSSLSEKWPSRGDIEYRHVTLRYDVGLEPVVFNASFSIKGGERVSGLPSTLLFVLSGRRVQSLWPGMSCVPLNVVVTAQHLCTWNVDFLWSWMNWSLDVASLSVRWFFFSQDGGSTYMVSLGKPLPLLLVPKSLEGKGLQCSTFCWRILSGCQQQRAFCQSHVLWRTAPRTQALNKWIWADITRIFKQKEGNWEEKEGYNCIFQL